MRELYATELSSDTDRNEAASRFVDEWVNRHVDEGERSVHTSIAETDDGSCTITLRQSDEAAGLEWHSEVSWDHPRSWPA
jgi:hypothetical protein